MKDFPLDPLIPAACLAWYPQSSMIFPHCANANCSAPNCQYGSTNIIIYWLLWSWSRSRDQDRTTETKTKTETTSDETKTETKTKGSETKTKTETTIFRSRDRDHGLETTALYANILFGNIRCLTHRHKIINLILLFNRTALCETIDLGRAESKIL